MSEAGAATGGIRLLYIDDDEGLCRLMQRRLQRRGLSVETCTSGPAGVEAAASGLFDIIVIDHFMPGQDGLETLEQLKRLPDSPPVIYVTGSDESRIAVAALKAGAADYVVKTGSEGFSDLLVSALEQAVERRRLQRAHEAAELRLRETNAQLEAVVARQEALLHEVNHRVANSLQLVSALVSMQASTVREPDAQAALRDTQSRIAAIVQIHRRLYTSHDVERVDMQDYLQGLVAELSQSLPDAAERPIRLRTEPIQLDTDKAVSLGVVVTELVTNAIKYAYADGEGGEVRVALERDSGEVKLTVEDDGGGMPVGGGAQGTGLGQRVIAAMAKSLHSKLQLDPGHNGVRAVLRFAG